MRKMDQNGPSFFVHIRIIKFDLTKLITSCVS
nr:MAG TPA: hypothetical protein [Caudoviricetes sp.]